MHIIIVRTGRSQRSPTNARSFFVKVIDQKSMECFGKVIDQLLSSSIAPWLDVPTICALESTNREFRRVLVLDEQAHERLWQTIAAPDLWLVNPRRLWTTTCVYRAFKAGECDAIDQSSSTSRNNDRGAGGGGADSDIIRDGESGIGNTDEGVSGSVVGSQKHSLPCSILVHLCNFAVLSSHD